MTYTFKQEYTYYRLEGGVDIDVFNKGHFTGILAGFLAFSWFESDTDLDVNLGPMGTQRAQGNFEDSDMGLSAAFQLKYELPFRTGWSILCSGRYEWLNLEDEVKVTETQASPLGTVSNSYSMPFAVDLTGPVLGFFIQKEF